MRDIMAKDIKCGMTIEWPSEGLTKRAVIKGVSLTHLSGKVRIVVDGGYVHFLDYTNYVVVLEEPKAIQPPEPTAPGARVMVNGMKLIRMSNKKFPWYCFDDDSFGITWNGLCGMGQVIIVDADPSWTSEESDPGWGNVTQHIEGPWPENDSHLREYRWRDSKGSEWFYDIDVISWLVDCDGKALYTKSDIPTDGPWNKVKE